MKEKEKKAVEAEIEKKACCEVSDNEVEGVTGGIATNTAKMSVCNNDKMSVDSSKLSMADNDKLSMCSSGSSRKKSTLSDKLSLN